MLNGERLQQICRQRKMSVPTLAEYLVRGGVDAEQAQSALRNWMRRLYTPKPTAEDVRRLANALGVEVNEISQWQASHRYAPSAARKARLVMQLITGRQVQDALDVLKFEHRRAAYHIRKVLESAIANADEQEADVESLVICEARVDGAGRRLGTKGWRAKDRGRAHPIWKEASHLYVSVAQERTE